MRYIDVDRALVAAGFVNTRSNGSHFFYVNSKTGRRTTVPKHRKDIPIGTLKNIERQAGVTLTK